MTIEPRGYREVFGIAWLGCGLFTLLCLISFSHTDLPLYTTHPTSTNFFGPVGAHWAALLIFSLGMGAYVFPALAFYLGLSLIFRESPVWRWKLISGLLLLVSIAGILHLQPYLGQDWAATVNTISPGGFLGDTVNSYVLTLLFGRMGAGVALGVLYAAAFSLFFDLQPRRVFQEFNLAIANYYRRKAEERLRKASPKDLLEMKQKEIAEQMRRLEKQLGSSDAGGPLARRKMAEAARSSAPILLGAPGSDADGDGDSFDGGADARGKGKSGGGDTRKGRRDPKPAPVPELAGVGVGAGANSFGSNGFDTAPGTDAWFGNTATAREARRRPAASRPTSLADESSADDSALNRDASAFGSGSGASSYFAPQPAPAPKKAGNAPAAADVAAKPAAPASAPEQSGPRLGKVRSIANATTAVSVPAPAEAPAPLPRVIDGAAMRPPSAPAASASAAPAPASDAAWPTDSFFADADMPFASGTGFAAPWKGESKPAAPAPSADEPMFSIPDNDERYMPKAAQAEPAGAGASTTGFGFAPAAREEERAHNSALHSAHNAPLSAQEVSPDNGFFFGDDREEDDRPHYTPGTAASQRAEVRGHDGHAGYFFPNDEGEEETETAEDNSNAHDDSRYMPPASAWQEESEDAEAGGDSCAAAGDDEDDSWADQPSQAIWDESELDEDEPQQMEQPRHDDRRAPGFAPPAPASFGFASPSASEPATAARPFGAAATPRPAADSHSAAQLPERPVRRLGTIGVQTPRPFGGPGATPSAPAPARGEATHAPETRAPESDPSSFDHARPTTPLPALFRGMEQRPAAPIRNTAAFSPSPVEPAARHAADYASETASVEDDSAAAADESGATEFDEPAGRVSDSATPAFEQRQPPQQQPRPLAAAQIFGPAGRPPVPTQQQAPQPASFAPAPAPAPTHAPAAPVRPAPLPQSPEVTARREREQSARSLPAAVPSVRLPGTSPLQPVQRRTFDPFDVVPEFEQPPKPAFVAAQSAVAMPPASPHAQHSAAPTRPGQPVAQPEAHAPAAAQGGTSRRMLATAHSGDSAETLTFGDYAIPPMDKLTKLDPSKVTLVNETELQNNARLIVDTLRQFGVQTTAGDITRGATITRYELFPAQGVRVDKIVALKRDIARTLKAERIQILAPIPGKNTVGVEIANKNKVPIVLRDLFESDEWTRSDAKIPIVLGKDVYGQVLVADLAAMPHMLVAGTTGSGKSVCINSILLSFLYKFRPDELRLILVDPKQVEMAVYNTIPHLVVPVVTDPKKVLLALRWVINEMEKRYKILAKCGVRNIHAFNNRPKRPASAGGEGGTAFEGSTAVQMAQQRLSFTAPGDDDDDDSGGDDEEIFIPEKLPFIVVVIDELADLMLTAPADVESAIARITAKARAAGIHLIVATQTPRKDVVTGIIKANIPSRVAFQVANALDSRIILDESGAENLVGKGDLLYLPPGTSKLTRGQGAFVSDDEVNNVVAWCAAQAPNCFEDDIHNKLSNKGAEHEDFSEEDIELIHKCWEVIRQEKRASTSMLQRRLRLGYNKAAWVVDFLERILVLAPGEGAKPREILVDLDDFELPI